MGKWKHERPAGFLGSELNEQRQTGECCDVILTIGERQFHAHRNVLAVNSPYFRAMFSNNMQESEKTTIPMDESIKEVEVMELLLDYFYRRNECVNVFNVQSLLPAADFLHLAELKAKCCALLKAEMTYGNCLGIAAMADRYACEELKKVATYFTVNNFDTVTKQSEFLELSLEDALELLKNDKLPVESEAAVFRAAMRWVRHDETGRKKHLAAIVSGVRLSLSTEKFLATTAEEDDLIRDCDECRSAIAEAIEMKNQSSPLVPMDHARTPPPQALYLICATKPKHYMEKRIEANAANGQTFPITFACIVRRRQFTITTLADRLYRCGGWDKFYNSYDDSEDFSGDYEDQEPPVATVECANINYRSTWTSLAPMSTARYQHGAAVLDGRIYAIGGICEDSDDDDEEEEITASVERYDPASDSWQYVEPLGTGRCDFAAVTLDDAIYVLGGDTEDAGRTTSVERFDLNTGHWSTATPMRSPREDFGCAAFQGKIFIAGGIRDSNISKSPLASVECYDPITEQWTDKGRLVEARCELSLAVVNGRLLAIGGCDCDRNGAWLTNVEEYVPETDSWRVLFNLAPPRYVDSVAVVREFSSDDD